MYNCSANVRIRTEWRRWSSVYKYNVHVHVSGYLIIRKERILAKRNKCSQELPPHDHIMITENYNTKAFTKMAESVRLALSPIRQLHMYLPGSGCTRLPP